MHKIFLYSLSKFKYFQLNIDCLKFSIKHISHLLSVSPNKHHQIRRQTNHFESKDSETTDGSEVSCLLGWWSSFTTVVSYVRIYLILFDMGPFQTFNFPSNILFILVVEVPFIMCMLLDIMANILVTLLFLMGVDYTSNH